MTDKLPLPPFPSGIRIRSAAQAFGVEWIHPLDIADYGRECQRLALEAAIVDLSGAAGVIPLGQPGSYMRGHYNGMLDAAAAIRRLIKELK